MVLLGTSLGVAAGMRLAPSVRVRVAAEGHARLVPDASAPAVPVPEPGQRIASLAVEGGPLLALGLVLVVVGGLLTRRAERAALARGGDAAGDLPRTLEDFAARIEALKDAAEVARVALGEGAALGSVAERLRELQLEAIEPIVEARTQLSARLGLSAFAEVFGGFSGAERALNRAWAALVDGHRPEALVSLARAVAGFAEAHDRLTAVSTERRDREG